MSKYFDQKRQCFSFGGKKNASALRQFNTLTIGIWPPNMSTTDICKRTRKVSLMLLALNSLKLSAQSPPWRRNDRPTAASARRSSRVRASPAKTMGGNASTVRSTSSSSALSGYSGCCSAGRSLQLPTDHRLGGSARRERGRPGEGRAGLGSSAGVDGLSGILGNTGCRGFRLRMGVRRNRCWRKGLAGGGGVEDLKYARRGCETANPPPGC